MGKGINKNNTCELLNYNTLIERLDPNNSHLLLGNGFNCSLGVYTRYNKIFEEMFELYPDYKLIESVFCKNHYDIEYIIGELQKSITKNSSNNRFIEHFIQNKIKSDFMKATNVIVNENLKNIYQKCNEGIYILLSKFQNYFTLNFDPFLYLLLMKYKKKDSKAIAINKNFQFFEQGLNKEEKEIYKIIKSAYQDGKLAIEYQNKSISKDLNKITKADFRNQVTKLIKDDFPKIKVKKITSVTNRFFDNLKVDNRKLYINDGFQDKLFKEDNSEFPQNVFFIHGAFHIYVNKNRIKKITQTSEESFSQRVAEILDSEDRDILCILKAENKLEDISKNRYLNRALSKLSEIQGEIVIFGCSLSDNDSHIFNQINNNQNIKRVYISTCYEELNSTKEKAKSLLPNKITEFFDYTTVSYTNS